MKKAMKAIDEFNKERDWDQFHAPVNLAKSIVIEAAELLECFQWNDDQWDRTDVEEELADVLSYTLQLCSVLGMDPEEIVLKKLEKTRKKYPVEKAKGVSTKYDKFDLEEK
ncbi:MAG: nucleotide pyrophosphohydrolase [Erysipelotrichaceae bacterium]|nr:nucleotide pyrophosphohydrolase [Erysipelotrichaceae bacterium]